MREFADAMLAGGLVLCGAMILVWLLRLRTQGSRGYVMASAFACLGGIILAVRENAPSAMLWLLGVILFLLLAADMGIKAYRQEKDRTP
jgi:hypothetical protein